MALVATQFAHQAGVPVSELFSYQYALVPDDSYRLPGFEARPFAGKLLTHCPKLEVTTLFDGQGADIGFCLGVAVDGRGVRLRDTRALTVARTDDGFWPEVEALATACAGRWLFFVDKDGDARIYGDACGLLNCVYDPLSGGVGSSLLLALTRDLIESDVVDYRKTMTDGQRLPFGHTRDAHARRLTANHYLSLSSFSETRFWPQPGDFAEVTGADVPLTIAKVRDRLGAVFAGIVTSLPTAVAVSGGNDSRNLVAAGKDTLGHVSRFFAHTFNYNSRTDYRSAVRMMGSLGYKVERHLHATPPYSDAEIEERNQRFQVTTGFGVSPHQISNVKFQKRPAPGEVVLTGHVMGMLRASNWQSSSSPRRDADLFGLKRCLFVGGGQFDQAFVAKWMPEYQKWLAGLPEDAQHRYADLAMIEQYLPNLGTMLMEYQDNFYVPPFNDRRLIALSGRLPIDYRSSNDANHDLLQLAAPELTRVSFAKDYRRSMKKAS